MKSYIFYTPEGSCLSPLDREVENLQVLGFESGETAQAALARLLDANPWIEHLGFNVGEIQSRELAAVI